MVEFRVHEEIYVEIQTPMFYLSESGTFDFFLVTQISEINFLVTVVSTYSILLDPR